MDEKDDKTVEFQNVSYHLPAWSVSILPDCKSVVFNTAKVTMFFSCMHSIKNLLEQIRKEEYNVIMESFQQFIKVYQCASVMTLCTVIESYFSASMHLKSHA